MTEGGAKGWPVVRRQATPAVSEAAGSSAAWTCAAGGRGGGDGGCEVGRGLAVGSLWGGGSAVAVGSCATMARATKAGALTVYAALRP